MNNIKIKENMRFISQRIIEGGGAGAEKTPSRTKLKESDHMHEHKWRRGRGSGGVTAQQDCLYFPLKIFKISVEKI